MSKELKRTTELWYKVPEPIELINECQTFIGHFEKKVRRFLVNQRNFIVELKRQVKVEIGFLPPFQKDILLSAFGIIVTENIAEEYKIKDFIEDISLLLEATNKKNNCKDEEFIALIGAFLMDIDECQHIISEFLENTVDLEALKLDRSIIQGLLIRRNYYPAFNVAKLRFESVELNVDPRFIAAIFIHYLEKAISKGYSSKIQPIHNLYEKLRHSYPELKDKELYFDLIAKEIIFPYYPLLFETLKARIDLRIMQIGNIIEERKRELEINTGNAKEVSVESAFDLIKDFISAKLAKKGEITVSEQEKLTSAIKDFFETITQHRSFSTISEKQQFYTSYLKERLFELLSCFPSLAIPLINIKNYPKFVENPKEFLEVNKKEMLQQLSFKLLHYIGTKEPTIKNLINAFMSVIIELLRNPTVYDLEL